jgi:hypothetical protein
MRNVSFAVSWFIPPAQIEKDMFVWKDYAQVTGLFIAKRRDQSP